MAQSADHITVEQHFPASKQILWEAITDHNKMVQWFFEDIPEFKPEVGFQTRFNVRSGERDFLHLWKVTHVDPPNKIMYNWRYEGYDGDSFVTFELSELEDGTLLKLTHFIVESFPQYISEFTPESCLAGWNYFIKQRLVDFLKNKQ